ncbi:MAG TPA: threonine aldolase family protein [Armatimonadota bacterium]|nr:threonine aldolase family protein [Armatimonadota bacterium]
MIDLISDTVTLPTPEMRKAMAKAEVGDSQHGEDPTVNRLQDAVCALLGKDSSLFLPSATMANEIAFKVHTRPGDEIIMDWLSHALHFEGGAPALLSGATIYPIHGERGVFTEEDVLAAIRPDDPHFPRTRLVSVENTHNLGGGTIWPLGKLMAVSDIARRFGLGVHMDGSRLMNAAVASGISAREYSYPVDSVTLCFSKGLGAPVGAVLAGNKEFVKEARRCQQVFGGAMRQAGIIAAGALYALQHNVDRLAEDHANARLLAERLADEEGIDVNPADVETNMVFFHVDGTGMTAQEFTDRLKDYGVRMGYYSGERVRAVTHLDVSRADILEAARAVHQMLVDARLGSRA